MTSVVAANSVPVVVAGIAAVVVGVVLVVAGATKLAGPAVWRSQAAGLGAPRWLVPVLPWLELVVGAGLITGIGRRVVAWVAVGLMGAFSLGIARTLAAGRHPPCACFGTLSAKPISWVTLARNAVLLALAILSTTR